MVKRKVIFNRNAKKQPAPQPAPTVMHQVVQPTNNSAAPQVVLVQRTKFRRLKDGGLDKKSRFERDITPSDRDRIIAWWNVNQRLVPAEDPVCVQIASEINGNRRVNKLSSMQVVGYFSYLCRLGLWTEERRRVRILRNIRRGQHTTPPMYTSALLRSIGQNWEQERADEVQRAQAHNQLRQARAQGQRLRIVASVAGQSRAVMTPALSPAPASVPEEEYDIKFAL